MTNAEHIRQMTDEELAKLLVHSPWFREKSALKWLKKERAETNNPKMENEEMMDKTLYLMVYDSLPEESKKAISDLWDTGVNNSGVWVRFGNVEATIGKVIWPFRNYTVDMEVLKQVQWERDIALEQLREIGKSLGEKMDDVAEAIKNNSDASNSTVFTTSIGWIHRPDGSVTVVPKYGWSIEEAWTSKYCPVCGAPMDGNDERADGEYLGGNDYV